MPLSHRNHPAWWAFAAHRLSGIVLALFLPAHFLVLGLVLNHTLFDGMLAWARSPWLKTSEAVLVTALALHLAGGLRLLVLEFLPWRESRRLGVALTVAFAAAAGLIFLLWGAR